MKRRDLKTYLGLFILACGVYLLRDVHGTFLNYVASFALVFLFWYLNDLSLSFSNLRNILLVSLFFGLIVIAVGPLFPSASEKDADLDPANIGRLKGTHETALRIYFDHRPSVEERYYKVDDLVFSENGLRYTKEPEVLDLEKMPRAVEWVHQSLGSHPLEEDLQKIEKWFKSSYSYSLAPGELSSQHPLDEFLFETKTGFCQHYAAALTTLLKLRGREARVVVGYAQGHWNPFLSLLTYEVADAHAWVEVKNGKKWQIVDPTDWVTSLAFEGRSEGFGFAWVLLAVSLGLVAILILARPKRDTVSVLLKKIGRLEKTKSLDSRGLTLSERVSRVSALFPKQAEPLQKLLLNYLHDFYGRGSSSTHGAQLGKTKI